MIRLKDRLAVVLHVPKTGGTSVRYALDPYAGEPSTPLPPKTVEVPKDWVERRHALSQHATASSIIKLYPDLSAAHFYAFIRNPWDRHVSAYLFFRARKIKPFCDMAWRQFLEAGWYPNQGRIVDGATTYTFLPFEKLQEGVDRICDEQDLPRVEVPWHKRQTVGPDSWYTDPRDRKFIERMCYRDIERMGYTYA